MAKIREKFWYIVTHTIFAVSFGRIGKRSLIFKPIQLDGVKGIWIDGDVYIAQSGWLMGNASVEKSLVIKRGTTIGHFAHIVAKKSVIIEKNVLIADRVFISDCTHIYDDINMSVKQQGVRILRGVTIGSGSWIGENACICGASIGSHCVIGANSVVTSDIPDYCVAAGSPARIVKKYDKDKQEWSRINSNEKGR